MHFVDHIQEHLRLTTWTIQRDKEKEALLPKPDVRKSSKQQKYTVSDTIKGLGYF
jgi:hypothetical protein